MVGEGSIKTGLDDLLAALKNSAGEPKSIYELSSISRLSISDVKKWLSILEKEGKIKIENRISGIYATWTGELEKTKPWADDAIDVGAPPKVKLRDEAADIEIAREQETIAKSRLESMINVQKSKSVDIKKDDIEKVEKEIEKVEEMISELKSKKIASVSEKQASSQLADDAQNKQLIHADEAKKPDEPALEEHQEMEKTDTQTRKIYAEGFESETLLQQPQPPIASKLSRIARKKSKIGKIKPPEPIAPSSVSIQFSERLARQMRKITNQLHEIEKLKMEKEKILMEHYMPMQRKLEVEIETISDRVLRLEKNILSLHQRAADLPSKVSELEKLQISTIRAHSEMKRAFDEASALIEESTNALNHEREQMQALVEASRQEVSLHKSKAEELENLLRSIDEMEQQTEKMVTAARAALAEQAERLASAEANAKELSELKGEIKQSIEKMKREAAAAKGALTTLEKQMQQMRQIEIWAESIRKEYEQKMVEIDDFIRNGNQEYEALRESVEANFVRRYLRELRQLTDSYSFEFSQAKGIEADLDKRISEEKKKLEELLEEARKISYLYEMQAKEAPGSDRFEARAETFKSMAVLSAQRTQLENMIAQIVKDRAEQAFTIAAEERMPAPISKAAPKSGILLRKKKRIRKKANRRIGSKRKH